MIFRVVPVSCSIVAMTLSPGLTIIVETFRHRESTSRALGRLMTVKMLFVLIKDDSLSRSSGFRRSSGRESRRSSSVEVADAVRCVASAARGVRPTDNRGRLRGPRILCRWVDYRGTATIPARRRTSRVAGPGPSDCINASTSSGVSISRATLVSNNSIRCWLVRAISILYL